MNLWQKVACAVLVAAGISAGQTAPAPDPTPVAASGPPSGPAATPPGAPASPATTSPAPAPDLTFKPNPAEAPLVPAVKPVPPASVPSAAKGSTAKPASGAGGKPATGGDSPLYILGPNDVVQVSVFDDTHLSGTYAIGPDGRISMFLIGSFKAVGMTASALQDLIAEKLGAYLNDPVVNVQLLRNNSKKYTLIGGVLKSGPYPLLQQTTILDALAASGGFKEFANQKKIVLRRGTKEFKFNYKDVVKGKHMDQNIDVEDGDIIVVPE